jgi:hypothetical protein
MTSSARTAAVALQQAAKMQTLALKSTEHDNPG